MGNNGSCCGGNADDQYAKAAAATFQPSPKAKHIFQEPAADRRREEQPRQHSAGLKQTGHPEARPAQFSGTAGPQAAKQPQAYADDSASQSTQILHSVGGENSERLDSDEEALEDIPPIVEVAVPPGPLGLLLDSEYQDLAVVDGFTALPDGSEGALEASGIVHPGYVLVAINGMDITSLSLDKVILLLQQTASVARKLTFETNHDFS